MLQPYLEHTPQIDPSVFVHPAAVIIGEVTIGAESSVWPNATLRGDDGSIVIGARSSIQDGAVIHATEGRSTTVIGDRVTVGHNAIVHGAIVADDVIVGMGAILLDNARIGRHCLIGAGALVAGGKEIPPRSLVLGSPGRVVRELTDEDLEWIAYSSRRYVEQAAIYRARAAD